MAIIIFMPYLMLSMYAIFYIPFLHFPYNYPFTTLLVALAIVNAFWIIEKKYTFFSVTFLIGIVFSIYTALWVVPTFLLRRGEKIAAHSNISGLSGILVDTAGANMGDVFYTNKVVLLDFWFRGCKPCYDKMPVLKKIADVYGGNNNVAILAVNIGVGDSFEEFRNEIRISKFGVQQYYLKDTSLLRKLRFDGYPSEIILDRKGQVIRSHSGFDKSIENVYFKSRLNVIDSLLNVEK
ncbi:MAG TPA: TlpA disulfide reductase family protein [Ferruginibacter sp.]|nr:TlpA disulfide reductase family protein [Ferruginibacter sp.]